MRWRGASIVGYDALVTVREKVKERGREKSSYFAGAMTGGSIVGGRRLYDGGEGLKLVGGGKVGQFFESQCWPLKHGVEDDGLDSDEGVMMLVLSSKEDHVTRRSVVDSRLSL